MTPTYSHEIPIRFIQDMPDSGADLLQNIFKYDVPEFARAYAGSEALTDCRPPELNCDAVQVYVDAAGEPVFGLILEVQRQPDEDKAETWLAYQAIFTRRLKRETALLVLCEDERTAKWARSTAIRYPTLKFEPLILGPQEIPIVTSRDDGNSLVRTVLSAYAHGKKPQAEQTVNVLYEELGDLPRANAIEYGKYAIKMLPEGASLMLEALMKSGAHDYGREIFVQERAEARAEGQAEGKAEGQAAEKLRNFREFLQSTVEAREWELSAEQEWEVAECDDPEKFRR